MNQLKYEEYKRDKKEKHEKHKKEQKNKKELEKLKNEFERYIQYYGFTIKKDTYIEYQGKYLMNCYPLINDYSQDEVIDYFETYIANTKNQLRDLMTEFCNLKKIPRIWRAIYIKTIAKFSRDSHKRDLYNMLILLYQKDGI